MPQTSRLLYYDLGMAADDDGVVEAFTVIRTTGAAEDDLRVLASRGFVVVLNDDLVSYISDWTTNNQIRKDRYTPSVHAKLLVKVISDGASDQPTVDGKPNGNQMETQYRLGKDRLVEGSIYESAPNEKAGVDKQAAFEAFWLAYPRKAGKKKAAEAFKKINPSVYPLILPALEAHKQSKQWTRDSGQYIPYPATWLNQERWNDEIPKRESTDFMDLV